MPDFTLALMIDNSSSATASSRLVLPSKKTIREALPTNDFVDVIKQISLLDSEDAKLIALMTFTGMRRNEVLGLRWEDIVLMEGLFTFKEA